MSLSYFFDSAARKVGAMIHITNKDREACALLAEKSGLDFKPKYIRRKFSSADVQTAVTFFVLCSKYKAGYLADSLAKDTELRFQRGIDCVFLRIKNEGEREITAEKMKFAFSNIDKEKIQAILDSNDNVQSPRPED